MKKNRLAWLMLAFNMICFSAPFHASAIVFDTNSEFTYETHYGYIEITGFTSSDPETHLSQTVEIPAKINGLPVTVIGQSAFSGQQFSEIILPDSLQMIQDKAFSNNSHLKHISIPDSVILLGETIFQNCTNLETAVLPNSLTEIPKRTFEYCHSLESVTIPRQVTTIGEYAFEECWSFDEMVIPDSVTTLQDYCFSHCHNMQKITIPDSVNFIGDGAFLNCQKLETLKIPDTITNVPYTMGMFTGIKEIIFSENVQNVGYFAVGYCENLKSVTFLNPNCQIVDDACVSFNVLWGLNFEFGGIIYGYEGSTAQKYAQKYGYEFRNIGETFVSDIAGDVSGDGKLSVVDFVQFKKAFLSGNSLPKICNMNHDNLVNVIDFALLKKALLKQ